MGNCPICMDDSNALNMGRHRGYDILNCHSCQLQFSDPMQDPGGGFYQECTLYEGRSNLSRLEAPSYDWRYKTFLRLCGLSQDLMLLDIGCGDGGFLVLAKDQGFNVFGIDLDDRAIRFARNARNIEHVVTGKWEILQSKECWKDFDAITLFDTLEHVSSPASLAATAYELLKPGGLIGITVPRLDRYPQLFDTESDYPPHHLTLWTPHALNLLMSISGFTNIRIIEKPLMIQDFYLHLVWRTRRIIRRLRRKSSGIQTNETRGTERAVLLAGQRIMAKLVIGPARLVLPGINRIVRILSRGRGFTLMAIARKPS